ncbi:MAG: IS3 family transposase [Oligoflexales bacterium]|nr:IS3 family transposase [Oligoflexales bacterium]
MIDIIKHDTAATIPIDFLCSHFGVSRSGFYNWQRRDKEPVTLVNKEKICEAIRVIFKDSKKTYGSPRVYDDLKERGFKVSENTVAKYMQEMGLDARLKKKFRVQTTDSNHSSPIADRLFKIEDHHNMPSGPGEVLAGDITYLKLGDSFLYLAVVIDIYSRAVVGWSMQRSLHTKLVLDALAAAMSKVGPDAEIIFHSDRGSQYASETYRSFCDASGVMPSMSRRGNCYDNAFVESWFGGFKKEWLYRHSYSTEKELRAIVFEYIEVWYNRKRKHSALGYRSPMKFLENQAVQ